MKTIILAAGYGTFGYLLTKDAPKALLPIRGKPVIEYIVNKVQTLDEAGDIFIVTNSRFFNQFKLWLDSFPNKTSIKIVNDGSKNHKDRLGAIKDLAFAVEKEQIDDDLLVIGGDNLFSFTLYDFIANALAIKPNPLIGVYDLNGNCKANKFGIVKIDERKKVIDFYEKPPRLNGTHLVSLCLYFLPKVTLHLLKEYLNGDNYSDSIGNYIRWLAKKSPVQTFEFGNDWFDIGDIDSYTEAVCSF